MSTQQTKAIELASRHAAREGYDVARYEASALRKDGQWEVFFKRNSDKPSPGDFFMVFVDDAAGRVLRLVPGK